MKDEPVDCKKLSMGTRTGFQERLKKACDGGKESRIKEEERGVETLICLSKLDATSAEWMNLRALTKIRAVFGRVVRTSEPTQMLVILVAG